MLEIFKKLLGMNEKKSGQIAKERLQFVIIHDRATVSPEVMEQLKADIIAVISKYMDINTNAMAITFEKDSESVALIANIPVQSLPHSPKKR